ncbi:MAG: 23S rRNA (pseudouridine(1915)-N(3))-methyltransferase RlmH [Steroidobacterales bacterium]
MRLRLIAIGTRMPDWVDAAFNDYWRRMRGLWKLELIELPTASRRQCGGAAHAAMAAEAQRILTLLAPRDFVVALDERGSERSTVELSHWLEQRRASGRDLAFIIGGPDGLAEQVLARGDFRWSLSRLTLPHGLVRVVLAEQIYRAATLLAGHPYHRE